ncbi:MAG: epoxyqueuosine reductase [Planctomycetota bacterium]|nr:MAG: epoxyqueuosine reductase [Planctomycetota bacterium]
MTPSERNIWIKTLARSAGFDLCGVARAEPSPRRDYIRAWLDGGSAGTMAYLHRHFEKRTDPAALLPGARSVVMTGLSYHRRGTGEDEKALPHGCGSTIETDQRSSRGSVEGRVAMYAWGEDYHVVIRRKLAPLADALMQEGRAESAEHAVKICVDTAPLLEREFAAAAGLGWIGKNTLVLNPALGSTFFLGAIVTTLDITPDAPMPDHCGTCRRCLDACPTAAFPEPYRMNASRCISYLTIERREAIPAEFHAAIGDRLFGCDDCQDVCPFNRNVPETAEPTFAPGSHAPRIDAQELLTWDQEMYRSKLAGTAITRAKLDMLRRNAGIVLKNARASTTSPASDAPRDDR